MTVKDRQAQEDYARTAMAAARAAGRVILGQRVNPRTEYKGAANPVTEADLLSEKTIVGMISESYPGHRIVGEEGGDRKTDSEFTWWIDPLDGTTNFAHGYPHYCVSIALARREEAIVGVVYDPLRDELFHAERGRGAFLNDERIGVSRVSDPSRSLLATGFPYDLSRRPQAVARMAAFLSVVQGVRRDGSAALNLAYVAAGRLDGFWEIGLNPWDTAAGAVIAEEAGARVSDFSGRRYHFSRKDVVAAPPALHSFMIATIGSVPDSLPKR
jgi:myo-inositol-1(or 4)-monophosphatase